ncbi:uncharacterized protein V1513DRAFT_378771 [Lipomyces chichibuensis]|uniref:uncharacterized protein n=1 Tax=Lipomyces chichibuensis TaxID=1546026 RepID=UPI003343D0C8
MDGSSLPSSSSDSSSPSSSPLLKDYHHQDAFTVMPRWGFQSMQYADARPRLWQLLPSFRTRRHIKGSLRLFLLGIFIVITLFSLCIYLRVINVDSTVLLSLSFGNSTSTLPAEPVYDSHAEEEAHRRAEMLVKFKEQFDMTRKLASNPTPLNLLRYCSNPRQKPSSANYLVSTVAEEGTMTRMDFGHHPPRASRYNPNILPFPKGYKYPYIGFARQSPKGILFHHEIVWCEMDWSETPAIGRKVLVCAQPAQKLDLAEWVTKSGLCKSIPFLALKAGHSDPRVLFSPRGEPLMVVGNNGQSNCMGQFVIDLRQVVPGLNWKMKLHNVPIRYKELTELPRPVYNEIEKNWFLMWDESNVGYVQHETEHRSVSALDGPRKKQVNIATPDIPKCVSGLKRNFENQKSHANDIHQATNSLRVTLCDFPCIPTIHNTVIVELMHMKYKNTYELFYRRYAIIMNATAPFNIIGRTGNLMYAGTDERTMLYSVSITWDHENHREHDEWDEEVHGGHSFLAEIEASEQKEREAERLMSSDDSEEQVGEVWESSDTENPEVSEDRTPVKAKRTVNGSKPTSASSATAVLPTASPSNKVEHPQNPLVNKYYHGWLDDTIMINIGINDADAGVLHVRAHDLLECIHVCE